ncbi:hypothetical protein D9757_005289 [Collybiopsis confluens]|uniref:Uncharacterized protein n=1 Tax=Collybiopsis confluens TaxID=2823264 RepID=A0A8H5HVK0_9AGAR|nr:hypothetical protein D9757_005289 [Collybiopsis confluens]
MGKKDWRYREKVCLAIVSILMLCVYPPGRWPSVVADEGLQLKCNSSKTCLHALCLSGNPSLPAFLDDTASDTRLGSARVANHRQRRLECRALQLNPTRLPFGPASCTEVWRWFFGPSDFEVDTKEVLRYSTLFTNIDQLHFYASEPTKSLQTDLSGIWILAHLKFTLLLSSSPAISACLSSQQDYDYDFLDYRRRRVGIRVRLWFGLCL